MGEYISGLTDLGASTRNATRNRGLGLPVQLDALAGAQVVPFTNLANQVTDWDSAHPTGTVVAPFTAQFWAYNIINAQAFSTALSTRTATNDFGFSLGIHSQINVTWTLGDGAALLVNTRDVPTVGSVPDAWHMYTLVAHVNAAEVWLDNVQVDSQAFAGTPRLESTVNWYCIGNYHSGSTGLGWCGNMARVGIWSRALSGAEIGALWTSGAPLETGFGTIVTGPLQDVSDILSAVRKVYVAP